MNTSAHTVLNTKSTLLRRAEPSTKRANGCLVRKQEWQHGSGSWVNLYLGWRWYANPSRSHSTENAQLHKTHPMLHAIYGYNCVAIMEAVVEHQWATGILPIRDKCARKVAKSREKTESLSTPFVSSCKKNICLQMETESIPKCTDFVHIGRSYQVFSRVLPLIQSCTPTNSPYPSRAHLA